MGNEENVKQKKVKTFMQKNKPQKILKFGCCKRWGENSVFESHVGYYFLPKNKFFILGSSILHL